MVRVGGVDIELRVWDWTHPTLPPWWCLLVPETDVALSAKGSEDALWPRPLFLWRYRRRAVMGRLDRGLARVSGVYSVAGYHTGRGWRATVVMIPATDESTAALRGLHEGGGHPEPQWSLMDERDMEGHFQMERAMTLFPTARLFPEDGLDDVAADVAVRDELGLGCPSADEVLRSAERQRRGGPGRQP